MNSEKDRLATKVEEQAKIIEELRKCEHMKIKRVQKYIKFFIESDENVSVDDVKKMVEQNDKFQKFINEKVKMKESESMNQMKEEGEDDGEWRKRYQETLKDNYIFHMLLERYIEQTSDKDKVISNLNKETKAIADKELEIWNLKQELLDKDAAIAKIAVDWSVTKASNQVNMQSISIDQGRPESLCCCSRKDFKELRHEIKTLRRESLSVKDRLRRLESNVAVGGKTTKSMKTMLKGVMFKSKEFDEKIYELADETRELIILHEDFTMLTNRLDGRIKALEKSSLEKEEQNRMNVIENVRKRRASFLEKILRKKA